MMIKLMARFWKHNKRGHLKINDSAITKFEAGGLEFETDRSRWHALTSPYHQYRRLWPGGVGGKAADK